MTIRVRLLVFLMLGLMMSACGFQLRGQHTLPESLDKIYVQGEATGLLLRYLKDAIRTSGATVVTSADRASAILFIDKQTTERQALSVGVAARVRQYETLYRVNYSLSDKNGKPILKSRTVKQRRDFSYNEELALAKNREERILIHEMQYQVAQIIMRNLSAVK